MPTLKIDDQVVPFEAGDTVIKAAHRAGIDVPHYCWHPGLSVAANCRMCLVELEPPAGRPALMLDVLSWDPEKQDYVKERKPKLVPACQQGCADGMVIKSQTSDHVTRARAAVQELLLLNHPVDCPICDQAGECRLQDYYLEHQGTKKRMHDEPIHKPKAVVFGPTIVYDAERCIVCTRCVRFSEEVAKDPVLNVRERGNLNEIVVSPGRQLDHAYTLMTEYVCPVGALTARDFRFKARVWFLRSVRSVCTGCATGCNSFTDFDPRTQTVQRYRPRENGNVNKYWMCDDGMLDYQRIHEHRVLEGRTQGKAVQRSVAIERAATLIKQTPPERLAIVLSAEHSNEDNYALLALGRDYIGATQWFRSGRPEGQGDDILRHADKNPNTRGVQTLLTTASPAAMLFRALEDGKIDVVIALGSTLGSDEQKKALEKAKAVIALSSHDGALTKLASVVLPASTWAEADGTFVNHKGLAQRSERAIQPRGDSLPAYRLVLELGKALGYAMPFKKVEDLRAAISGPKSVAPAQQTGAAP